MAKKRNDTSDESPNDFDAGDLIAAINKEFGARIAYNLSTDEAPTNVKRWLDTGSILLNYAIRNASGGGYPEGRIIEVAGLTGVGKSHLAIRAARHVQEMGGLVVYIDTENATSVELLAKIGVDVRKRFVYCDAHCTEDVFSIIESTILKAKQIASKDVPILVVWDSVGGSSPKAELDGDYDQNSVGLQARTLAKGFRKITGVIGQNNVTLLCLNQLSTAIGVMHGDPHTSKGGNAIPYHSSVRIRLGSGNQVKDKAGTLIGSRVTVSIKKNKLAPYGRKFAFDIIFGKGIVENDSLFDEVRAWCKEKGGLVKDGKKMTIEGDGGWKELTVFDEATGDVVLSKKFHKADFTDVMNDLQYNSYVMALVDAALTTVLGEQSSADEGESPDTDEE